MQKIYNAQDINEANILKGLLEANNIDAVVDGFYLQGGIGEMAPSNFAAISVEQQDAESAMEIILEYEKNNTTSAAPSSKTPDQKFNKNLILIPIIIIAFFIATLLFAQ